MPAKVSPRAGKKGTPGPMAQRLTAQQELFVEALCSNDMHGKGAAIAAGIAEKNAAKQASVWLDADKYPQITAAIQAKREQRRNTVEIKAERIIQELARIAFFNPKRLLGPDGKKPLGLHEMPDDVAAALSNIGVTYGEEQDGDGNYHVLKHIRYTPHDKLTALKQLAGMLGLDNGEALKIINNVTNNTLVLKWDDLYRKPAALTAKPDPVEDAIRAEEEGQPSPAAQAAHKLMAPDDADDLNVVNSND